MGDSREVPNAADNDGRFVRSESRFRDHISKAPGAKFPPEKDRYVLYVNYGCPWAHRTIITRALKSLEPLIQVIATDIELTENGWLFTGRNGSPKADPLYGFANLKQLYLKADPDYVGRYSVPVLWDKTTGTIVNNESSEIIRMFYDAFDDFLEPDDREVNKPGGGFYPPRLRAQIDAMNAWVYPTVNNGVYRCGFAATQEAYDEAVYPLFQSLDRLEAHLADPAHQPYLFGDAITEADIRLYTTLVRFDVAYHGIFLCNLKMIRHDYPRLSKWLRHLYWDESHRTRGGAFKKTTFFELYKYAYLRARTQVLAGGADHKFIPVLPRGPSPDIEPLTDEEERELIDGTAAKLNGLTIDTTARPSDAQGMGAIFGADVDDVSTPTTTAPPTSVGSPRSPSHEADDADTGFDEKGEFHPRRVIQRRTTYNEENAKWYKAAKKAEKKMGAPNMHLAL